MTCTRFIDTWVAFAAAGLCLLGATTLVAKPQQGSVLPPPKLSRRPVSTKHAWHSGPATTPPQTEVVPPPPDAPPRAKPPRLKGQAEERKPADTKLPDETPAASDLLSKHSSASAAQEVSRADAALHNNPDAPGPEAQRIRVELNRLRNDAGARCAFYDELRRTVERVRAGQQDEGSQNLASPRPAAPQSPDNPGKKPNPPATNKPDESPPAKPKALQLTLRVDGMKPERQV